MSLAAPVLEEDPVARYLREQRRLETPVARFTVESERDARAAAHQRLIPLSAPAPNEQYAFAVDLDLCTGCKGCVAACHSLNGLDDEETWRDVGLLHGTLEGRPYHQTLTTACHHCEEPACLHGCPVLAYEKDAATGIVLHLDDQCIGCQYCVLKCPYDVPKYNPGRGIVRKCDMCHGRLAAGEAPACAQACPNEAIRITVVKVGEGRKKSSEGNGQNSGFAGFPPGTPDSEYTRPTTVYRSRRGVPADAVAGDAWRVRPQHAHWPLVFMLVLTQGSVGTVGAAVALPKYAAPLAVAALIMCAAGLGASVLHLGRPLKAWRAFLGWRRSWLSREVIAFGGYFPALASLAGIPLWRGGNHAPAWWGLFSGGHAWLLLTVFLAGLAGVFTSIMVYHDTRRKLWRLRNTAGRFGGTAVVIGAAVACLVLAIEGGAVFAAAICVVAAGAGKIGVELWQLRRGLALPQLNPARQTAEIILACHRPAFVLRLGAMAVGCILFVAAAGMGTPGAAIALAAPALLLCLVGELAERSLFFRAVDAPRMPGGFGS